MLHHHRQDPRRARSPAQRRPRIRSASWRLVTGAATAIGLSSAAAAASVASVQAICEPTPAGVKTVNVRLTSHDMLEYSFRRLPGGQTQVFTPGVLANSAKFALAPGIYRLSYRNPAFAGVAAYAEDVVVRPYRLVNGACAAVRPLSRAEAVKGQAQ